MIRSLDDSEFIYYEFIMSYKGKVRMNARVVKMK